MKSVADHLESFFRRAKTPVLFAGAGVSVKAGMPTWPDYMKNLAGAVFEYDQYTKYQIDKAIKANALGDAAAYYMMCRDMPEAIKLAELVKPFESYDAKQLASLIQLPFLSIVTTNFDRALFDAYAAFAHKAAKEVNIDDPTLGSAPFLSEAYIARIHGRVEVPSSLRLTSAALDELEKNRSYQTFLEHVFSRRQVLFVGFSFYDPAIRAVLRAVRRLTGSMHQQEHLALVQDGAPAEFIVELEKHSIRRLEYSADNRHQALWEAISECARRLTVSVPPKVDPRELPFAVAKQYLATVFARTKISSQREPLAQAIAEGVVSGLIHSKGAVGASEEELVSLVQGELRIDSESAARLTARSVLSLTRSGLCRTLPSEGVVRYVGISTDANQYERAISQLVSGAIQRFVLMERGRESVAARSFLGELFSRLLLTRGWDLGAAFAARKMPPDLNVTGVANELQASGLKSREVSSLIRAVESLLLKPEDAEAELLAELGSVAFGLELLLESPHDVLFLQRTLPERFYFDANVIMPAITLGHPHHELFTETIRALKEAAGTATFEVSLRVYEGFLNEIVSHRQLALEAMKMNGGEGEMWEARSVGLYGSGNVNVFVGAYFNYKQGHPEVSFEEFLSKAAPFSDERKLRRHLESLGFVVVKDKGAPKKESDKLLHALEKFNATRLEIGRKSAIVISHDASQLAILNAELDSGKRTMLVSADRGIRYALEYEGFVSVSSAMITHLGLSQLVELLVGRLPAARGLASILWMSPVSDDTGRIRNHLVSLALREHNAALAMNMGDIVAEIAEDAGMELARKKLALDVVDTDARREVHRTLEGYESRFFERMNAEVAKMRRGFHEPESPPSR